MPKDPAHTIDGTTQKHQLYIDAIVNGCGDNMRNMPFQKTKTPQILRDKLTSS